MIAYLNGQYLEKEKICISPDDRGFLFADGLYEVVRFYHGRPFGLDAHQQRLENGARNLRFNRTSFPEFSEVNTRLIKENKLDQQPSAIVYFQVTRGVAPRSHRFPPKDTPLTIYAFSKIFSSNVDEQQNGAKAILVEDDRWDHCNLKTIALLPNTLAHQRARDVGAIEALFVRQGLVQEGTHSNLMMVKEDQLLTPPLTQFVLPGITRQAILDIARQQEIPVIEQPITPQQIKAADEVMIVGTTVEVTPIIQIDEQRIANGHPGPITKKLQQEYWRMVKGVRG